MRNRTGVLIVIGLYTFSGILTAMPYILFFTQPRCNSNFHVILNFVCHCPTCVYTALQYICCSCPFSTPGLSPQLSSKSCFPHPTCGPVPFQEDMLSSPSQWSFSIHVRPSRAQPQDFFRRVEVRKILLDQKLWLRCSEKNARDFRQG